MSFQRWLSKLISDRAMYGKARIKRRARPKYARPTAEELETRLAPTTNSGPSLAAFGQLPMTFEANQGQTNPQVKFLSTGNGYGLFLTANQAVLSLVQPGASASDPAAASTTVVSMQLQGASSNPTIVGLDQLGSTSNYFTGSNPTQWVQGVSQYGQVEYQNVYPGVNVDYTGNGQQLQFDFTIAAGANPSQIQLGFTGADQLSIDAAGNLDITSGGATVVDEAPVLYQVIGGQQQPVAGQYVIESPTQVGFSIGAYNPAYPLIIDPTLSYSTYLGGSGTEYGLGIAVDSTGKLPM